MLLFHALDEHPGFSWAQLSACVESSHRLWDSSVRSGQCFESALKGTETILSTENMNHFSLNDGHTASVDAVHLLKVRFGENITASVNIQVAWIKCLFQQKIMKNINCICFRKGGFNLIYTW